MLYSLVFFIKGEKPALRIKGARLARLKENFCSISRRCGIVSWRKGGWLGGKGGSLVLGCAFSGVMGRRDVRELPYVSEISRAPGVLEYNFIRSLECNERDNEVQ